MTTYLLDTNACIALINGTEINVRSAGPDGEFDTADDIPKVKQ